MSTIPPRPQKPNRQRPSIEAGSAVAGLFFAIVALIVTISAQVGVLASILISLGILVLAIVAPALWWFILVLGDAAGATVRKVRQYDELWTSATRLESELAQERNRVRQLDEQIAQHAAELEQERSRVESLVRTLLVAAPLLRQLQFDIVNVTKRDNEVLLVIKRKKSPKLTSGMRLIIVDTIREDWLGEFEVRELVSNGYLARAIEIYDSLWWGYMHRLTDERAHLPPNPDIVAFAVVQLDEVSQ